MILREYDNDDLDAIAALIDGVLAAVVAVAGGMLLVVAFTVAPGAVALVLGAFGGGCVGLGLVRALVQPQGKLIPVAGSAVAVVNMLVGRSSRSPRIPARKDPR